MIPDYPDHWKRGELLDHQLFDKGQSRCKLLSEEHIEKTKYLSFYSREEAQAFISWWYAPASAKMMERECPDPVNTPQNCQKKSAIV